jgi:hypothetical protein
MTVTGAGGDTGEPDSPRSTPHRCSAWWPAAVVAVSVAYFVTMACLWLNRPGLDPDETNFVDAALGGQYEHQLFVYKRLGGFPLLVIPYIGTVKAALFAPIFAIFGVSVPTIRLPAIALSAATLVAVYLMGREVIGRWSAILVVLMATCPTFIFMSKVDWGPIAVAMLLSTLLLLAFFKYLNTAEITWLWLVFAIALVGVFDKQNFLWLIVGAGVGAVVVYRRRLWALARGRPEATFVAVASFVVCLLLFGLVFVLPNISSQGPSSLQDPIPHMALAWDLYQRTIGYSEVTGYFTYALVPQPAWMDLQWVFSFVALIVLALRRLRGPLPDVARLPARAACFFVIVFAVMMVEVASTRQAVGAWHVIELLPYPELVLLCSVVAVWRSGPSFRTAISVIAAPGLSLIVAAQAVSTARFVSLMQNPGRLSFVFSTDIYKDAAFLHANGKVMDEVVSAGWGSGTPLFALACPADRQKYRDDVWSNLVGLTPATATSALRTYFGDKRILLVSVHDAPHSGLPSSLYADTGMLEAAYVSAFPGRHPQQVLTTAAYDITYFGPDRFQAGQSDC